MSKRELPTPIFVEVMAWVLFTVLALCVLSVCAAAVIAAIGWLL
jgi:nitrate reductase NapE component